MKKSKIYKFTGLILAISFLSGLIFYFQLSQRKKAIIKTQVLHTLGFMDDKWKINDSLSEYKMLSPTLLIDDIYKSMEGPQSSRMVQLSPKEELIWITGFSIKALDSENLNPISNEFICHMNVDINDEEYYNYWNLKDRIGKQFPRLTSLSNGFLTSNFPDGYGVPMKGNSHIKITSQALNHNQKKILKKIKHEVSIKYQIEKNEFKPLMSKTVFIQLPYDFQNPYKSPLAPEKNFCIPVDSKYHNYTNSAGEALSGHWVIPKGKNTYKSSINEQLQLKDSLRLHYAAIHVHPFSTSIALYDKTLNQTLFKSKITNLNNKIGLKNVEAFSSEKGIWLYHNHEYELVLEVDNPFNTKEDMMGSMFLFFYDKELEDKIAK